MSAAVTSGAVALIAQAHPDWTPDRIKFALMATAHKAASSNPLGVGAGVVDAYDASFNAPAGVANVGVTGLSDASGTLNGSRGNVLVTGAPCPLGPSPLNPMCGVIYGNVTAQGNSWESQNYTQSQWTPTSWYQSQWVTGLEGNSWEATQWYGNSWEGNSWEGSSWDGGGSDTSTSYGSPVVGSAFYGAWG
jgi:hypothetical protein